MTHSEEKALSERAKSHVLLFTKYPIPGFAKTRLIPAVGPEQAAEISRQLTERIVSRMRKLLSSTISSPAVSRIYFAAQKDHSIDAHRMREWLGTPSEPFANHEVLIEQTSGDLGNRLTAAFSASFKEGAEKAVVVGADIPEIDEGLIGEALKQLDDYDVVIGPADDGGYYLLGMKQLHPQLFNDIAWSTDTVFESTVDVAKASALSVAKLKTLRDIDLPEDLPYFEIIMNQ